MIKNKIYLLIGILIGLFFGFLEIININLQNDPRLLTFSDFISFVFITLLYYSLFGILFSFTLGKISIFLIKQNKIKVNTDNSSIVFATSLGFIFFSLFSQVTLYSEGTWVLENFWKVIIFSPIISIGFTYLISKFLSFNLKTNKVVVLLIITILFIILLLTKPKNTSSNENTNLEKTKPNILWIVMDTARADHLSTYGYEKETSPNLDNIAKDGVVYLNNVSPSTWTLPSHASMVTGMFPSKHGADGSWQWLGDNFTTIGEVLKKEGYNTYGISNADSFSQLTNLSQGFDEFVYLPRNPSPLSKLSIIQSLGKLVDIFAIYNSPLDRLYEVLSSPPLGKIDAGATFSNKIAKSYIENSLDSKKPFFMFINYVEPHRPYGDTIEYLKDKDLEYPKGHMIDIGRKIGENPQWYYPQENVEMSNEDKEIINSLYDMDLLYLDQKIGEIVDHLENKSLLEDTLIIITSDHGENLGQHNVVNHVYGIWRELTHVPLIIRYPKYFPKDIKVSTITQTIDVFPTILDVIGNNSFDRSDLQGYSLLKDNRPQVAYSEGRNIQPPNYLELFSEYQNLNQALIGLESRSIQDNRYEYIEISDKEYLLYDLKNDSNEKNNIIQVVPQKAQELKSKLNSWLTSFKHYF